MPRREMRAWAMGRGRPPRPQFALQAWHPLRRALLHRRPLRGARRSALRSRRTRQHRRLRCRPRAGPPPPRLLGHRPPRCRPPANPPTPAGHPYPVRDMPKAWPKRTLMLLLLRKPRPTSRIRRMRASQRRTSGSGSPFSLIPTTRTRAETLLVAVATVVAWTRNSTSLMASEMSSMRLARSPVHATAQTRP